MFKQSFKALEHCQNSMLPHIMTDFRICAALLNAFHKRRYSDGHNAIKIARLMKENINKPNILEKESKELKLKKFVRLESDYINDFPKIENKSELEMYVTCGSYQLKQAECYLGWFI